MAISLSPLVPYIPVSFSIHTFRKKEGPCTSYATCSYTIVWIQYFISFQLGGWIEWYYICTFTPLRSRYLSFTGASPHKKHRSKINRRSDHYWPICFFSLKNPPHATMLYSQRNIHNMVESPVCTRSVHLANKWGKRKNTWRAFHSDGTDCHLTEREILGLRYNMYRSNKVNLKGRAIYVNRWALEHISNGIFWCYPIRRILYPSWYVNTKTS